jgi:branched-chain amino acid transport system substrate-binding protein
MQTGDLGETKGSRARLLLALIATAGIVAAAASCSLIVDTNADACVADTECTVPGQVCSKVTDKPSICAPAVCSATAACKAGSTCMSGACKPDMPCTTAADCKDAALTCTAGKCVAIGTGCDNNAACAPMGDHVICRKDTHKCVNLITTACTTIHGDDKDDNAFIIGSILPTTGPDMSAGGPAEDGITLALDEFKQNVNGLPPLPGGTARRPYVLVGCSDNSDDATALAAAKHLAEDVGVPAIIGGSFSGTTIKLATTVTIADKVLLFSPSATSADITNIDDSGLVWRTAPSDNLQASALSRYVPTVEKQVRTELALMAGDPTKLAILNKGDSYGNGLAKTLKDTLVINGMKAIDQATNFTGIDYGNPDDPMSDPLKYGDAISAVLKLRPHIVLIFGGNEGITDILSAIEAQWGATPAYRPRYIFSDGGEVAPLWDYVNTDDNLRQRITGSAPGAGVDEPLFKSFHAGYLNKFPTGSPDVFGAAGAYDIAYLLAYAAMGLKAQPITGPNLALQLTKMSSGPQVDVGTDINAAATKVSAGSIDFNGASGPLNFDPKTGEAPSDIQIWCIPNAGGKAGSATNSGLYFDAKTQLLAGAIGAVCN